MAYNESAPTELYPVYATVEIVCAVLAVTGNLLVILVFSKYRILRTVTNYYVISLASADLLVGLFGIPFALATSVGLPRNFHGCVFMNSLLVILCTSSILSLVAVTVDRFWCIVWPMTYPARMTRRNALVIILFCWLLAFTIGLLPTVVWNKGPPVEPRCFFTEVIDEHFLAFVYFATIVAPTVFMAIAYFIIYTVVRRQVQRLSLFYTLPSTSVIMDPPPGGGGENVNQQSQRLRMRQNASSASLASTTNGSKITPTSKQRYLHSESKAARNIAVIVILFVVSWFPLYTLNTVVCFCVDCHVPSGLLKMLIVLSHFNSAWNPVLYAWGLRDFRKSLLRFFGHSPKPTPQYIS